MQVLLPFPHRLAIANGCPVQLVNLGQCIVAIYGSYTGLGTRDDRLNDAMSIEGLKVWLCESAEVCNWNPAAR